MVSLDKLPRNKAQSKDSVQMLWRRYNPVDTKWSRRESNAEENGKQSVQGELLQQDICHDGWAFPNWLLLSTVLSELDCWKEERRKYRFAFHCAVLTFLRSTRSHLRALSPGYCSRDFGSHTSTTTWSS